MAGISPGLLRAWERRYGLIEPKRTDSGYRVYSPQDVELLSAAARLVGAGHSISEVARLGPEEIRRAAGQLEARAPGETLPVAPGLEGLRTAIDAAIRGAMQAIEHFDRERFEDALLSVMGLGALPPAAACEEVLLPLLRAIGDAWERGTMSVAAEHFGSALVRAKILGYLQYLARPGQGPRMVCACPEQERHEGGLLAFAVHAAASGWDIVYLGASTPVSEAIDTAVQLKAAALALSITDDSADVAALISALADLPRAHPRLRVIVGGRMAVAHRQALERAGFIVGDRARTALDPLRADSTKSPGP
jgi:MerR family transcriptional regulator, light-induced transcriptional regulator